ncbi:hypothetical protein THAOC_15162 [Thalassiosira oceanica]|uniref:Uncharacterized protein n=1 Tax=Thalassiosira oceanica TaxID=159749 RepID=K0SGN5_THAOC|nr:hypothetical protein THAOC_15162 [Thalassiosira oceanica]|eukprot:EJK64139.1 hypothetical protein THAOC_15162 [Thalassiosira oceanica]
MGRQHWLAPPPLGDVYEVCSFFCSQSQKFLRHHPFKESLDVWAKEGSMTTSACLSLAPLAYVSRPPPSTLSPTTR